MIREDLDALRISALGECALLLDAGQGAYRASTQARIWALAQQLEQNPQVTPLEDIVPGMNNLMVVFRPATPDCADRLRQQLRAAWLTLAPRELAGTTHEVLVSYDATAGSDLDEIASDSGLDIEAIVRLHSQAVYRVACVGGMPGFAYLSGLDAALHRPRRAVPRTRVEQGAVIIGGQQASIMPISAPTGWHILGQTATRVFDAAAAQPCLMRAGDSIRFRVAEVRR
ncbi:5-oxoprolinase subunit PxpB [Bordetella genomosp. 12]|uniref:5-oxoprolinase subunit PxpB n=1 Tax=Bordetella genomosp. 12 TaxID=463035 RepID=UPI001ABFA76F|nr:5-oxoprolinase subunit PxpB [Bordetella genomosp. 12]